MLKSFKDFRFEISRTLTNVDFTVVLPRKILFCRTCANSCVTELEDKTEGDDHDQNGDIRHDFSSSSSKSQSRGSKFRTVEPHIQSFIGAAAWVGCSSLMTSLKASKKFYQDFERPRLKISSSKLASASLFCKFPLIKAFEISLIEPGTEIIHQYFFASIAQYFLLINEVEVYSTFFESFLCPFLDRLF